MKGSEGGCKREPKVPYIYKALTKMSDYLFNNMGRIGLDRTDNTQRNLQNSKFANYNLSSYFSDNTATDTVEFAIQQPAMVMSGTATGHGLNGRTVDYESLLYLKVDQERSLEKLQLSQRPFLTVPYLGKGSCNPDLESRLMQGEVVSDKKSVSTVMEKSFMQYTMQPEDSTRDGRALNPKFTVEEAALDGWVRGGVSTRELSQDMDFSKSAKNTRPSW